MVARVAPSWLLLLLPCLGGCSAYAGATVGPTVGMEKPGATWGTSVDAHGGLGWATTDGTSLTGVDATLRGKVTNKSQLLGAGGGYMISRVASDGGSETTLRFGATLPFERYDDKLFVGFAPYASAGGGVALSNSTSSKAGLVAIEDRDRVMLTFGTQADVDFRLSRQQPILFLGVYVGLTDISETLRVTISGLR